MPKSNSNSISPTVCLSQSREEWIAIRECYVKSFFTYPLYKYIEPDPIKREKFLRVYMDANYDVAVGNGDGIILAVRIPDEEQSSLNDSSNKKMKTIGGALLVPPSVDGCGWAGESDEPFWKAYEEYGLRQVSEEALERVKRYEEWENKSLAQKASRTGIPLWNGLFCAIEPEYASQGFGSAVYQRGVKIMARHWFNIRQKQPKCSPRLNKSKAELDKPLRALMRSLSCHPSRFSECSFQKSHSQVGSRFKQEKQSQTFDAPLKSLKNQTSQSDAPLAIVISHSERAAHFHRANGFHSISRIPFYDPVEDITPFTTHVMVLDPFKTGRIDEFMNQLNGPKKMNEIYEQEKLISYADF